VGFISEDEHREIYSKCPVRKNDILLTKDGANTGNCAINTIENEFSLLSSVAVIRGNPIIVNSIFLYHSIQSDYFQRQIFEAISGLPITRITLEKINAFSIIFPSLPEQQRIADCLSSLDELIAAQSQKIEALKTHKRGLMQQLFPATEEVQG
jgi:type I restriction enzyme S subunit